VPRCATARSASVTDGGAPTASIHDPRPASAGQLVEMGVARFAPRDVVGAVRRRGVGLMGMPGQHRQRAAGEECAPSASESLGVPECAAARDDPAAEFQAGRRPPPGAVGAWWVDAPRRARQTRVDHDSGPNRMRALGPRLGDAPGDLVAEDEGERAHRRQGGRWPGVVGEEVEVAAADAPCRHGHAGPRLRVARARASRPTRPGTRGNGHVELRGAHSGAYDGPG
jgi:hypothetical protein